eukprot:SAG31_NODE_642_length_13301_cov_14.143084_13_plen_254_part_00
MELDPFDSSEPAAAPDHAYIAARDMNPVAWAALDEALGNDMGDTLSESSSDMMTSWPFESVESDSSLSHEDCSSTMTSSWDYEAELGSNDAEAAWIDAWTDAVCAESTTTTTTAVENFDAACWLHETNLPVTDGKPLAAAESQSETNHPLQWHRPRFSWRDAMSILKDKDACNMYGPRPGRMSPATMSSREPPILFIETSARTRRVTQEGDDRWKLVGTTPIPNKNPVSDRLAERNVGWLIAWMLHAASGLHF